MPTKRKCPPQRGRPGGRLVAMNGPEFIAVVPADVEGYGAAAAIVLALIRYRTEVTGPGRIEREGHRWWRTTLSALSRETGLSVKAVRTGLRALDEVVLANHFPPLADQSLAYRVRSGGDALTCQLPVGARPDLPVARAGISDAPAGTDRAPTGTPPCPSGHLHISMETNEEGGEGACRGGQPTAASQETAPANGKPATTDVCRLDNDPPKHQSAIPPPTPAELAVAADLPRPPNHWPARCPEAEPARFCDRHPTGPGLGVKCGPCGDARHAKDAWAKRCQQFNTDLAAAKAAWNGACRQCDEKGWRLGEDGTVCDDALRCLHLRLWEAYWVATGVLPLRNNSNTTRRAS